MTISYELKFFVSTSLEHMPEESGVFVISQEINENNYDALYAKYSENMKESAIDITRQIRLNFDGNEVLHFLFWKTTDIEKGFSKAVALSQYCNSSKLPYPPKEH